jgi:aryl-alcohol dehydrogenase-like predicted oxidoreductase
LGGFQVEKRPLGSTGLECSILGMGGFHLGTVADQAEVNNMVAKAIDHGINIFDNAWEFHRGLSEEKLGVALKGKRDKVIVMSAVCTHGPSQDVAMRMLDASLTRLHTDHLDVWQIHEIIYHNDPALIYASDSVLGSPYQGKAAGEGPLRGIQRTQAPGYQSGDVRPRLCFRCSPDASQSTGPRVPQL